MPDDLRVNIFHAVEVESLHNQEPKNRVRGGKRSCSQGFSIKTWVFMYCRESAPTALLLMWLWIQSECGSRSSSCVWLDVRWILNPGSVPLNGEPQPIPSHFWILFMEAGSLLGLLMLFTWIKSTFNLVGCFPLLLRMKKNLKSSVRIWTFKEWLVTKKRKIYFYFYIHSRHFIAIALQHVGMVFVFIKSCIYKKSLLFSFYWENSSQYFWRA